MNWNRIKRSRSAADVDCGYASVNLSRYLDNDLASADATAVAAHLHGCLSCRNQFEVMRAQQTLVGSLQVPPGALAARDRVLKRLEAAVPSRRTALAPPARTRRLDWRVSISAASLAVCGLAAFCLVNRRPAPTLKPTLASEVTAAVPGFAQKQLPASDEMAVLFALHDKQIAVRVKALAPSPSPAAHRLAKRHPDPKTNAKESAESQEARFAKIASKVAGDNLALGQGNHGAMSADYLVSDDVPEAL